jgi:hypothetical protein
MVIQILAALREVITGLDERLATLLKAQPDFFIGDSLLARTTLRISGT